MIYEKINKVCKRQAETAGTELIALQLLPPVSAVQSAAGKINMKGSKKKKTFHTI